MTPVNASSSGMPAATSVPNATSRMISVSGSESVVGLVRSLAEDLLEVLLGAAVAELLDDEPRVRRWTASLRCAASVTFVSSGFRVAGDVEGHHDDVPVLRDLGPALLASGPGRARRRALQAPRDISHARPEPGLGVLLAGDQDRLARGLREGVVDELGGGPESPTPASCVRASSRRCRRSRRRGPRRPASRDRGLPMAGAPAAGPCCDVARRRHAGPLGGGRWHGARPSPRTPAGSSGADPEPRPVPGP